MKYNLPVQKQPMMRTVIVGLLPAVIASIYFYGWVSMGILLLSVLTCMITEWLFARSMECKVTEASVVTGILFALVLPPTIPFYMVIIGAAFGVTFGKMAFGGFGCNVFNPALTGRCFIYITFPIHMTARWVPAANFSDFPGGFAAWRFLPLTGELSALTTATPSHAYRSGTEKLPDLLQLILGNINGSFEKLGETLFIGGGVLGEGSAVLLILGGLYIMYKKTAKWRLVVSFLSVYTIVQIILHALVPELSPPLLYGLFSGGVFLAAFFMVTDPVSAPKTYAAQLIYGSLIAVVGQIIKTFSLFAGGIMFAILIGNMFAPLMDHTVRYVKRNQK